MTGRGWLAVAAVGAVLPVAGLAACGGPPTGVLEGQVSPPCVPPGTDRENLQIAETVTLSERQRTIASETVFSPRYRYRLVVSPGTYWLSVAGVHSRVTVVAGRTTRPREERAFSCP